MLEIRVIRTRQEMEAFIGFPDILYKGDQNYVPALYRFEKALFDRTKNTFFRHAEVNFFLAMQGKEITGRIAVVRNYDHITQSGEQEGFFGFFESVDDRETAGRLLEAAGDWLKWRRLKKMTGPENFSTNEVCGILAEGFDDPPVFMLPYNKPYYGYLLESHGLRSVMKLFSYRVIPTDALHRLESVSARAEGRLATAGITFRHISFRDFDHDITLIREAYNQSFSNNWGFVPLTEEDFLQAANQLRKICLAETIILACKEERCIGFIVNVPDINQVLIHVKNGRLFPFGFISMIRHRKNINRYRILIMGVLHEYRHTGIDLCLISKTFQVLDRLGIRHAEAAYVMDDNNAMKKILDHIGAVPVKEYRLYQGIL